MWLSKVLLSSVTAVWPKTFLLHALLFNHGVTRHIRLPTVLQQSGFCLDPVATPGMSQGTPIYLNLAPMSPECPAEIGLAPAWLFVEGFQRPRQTSHPQSIPSTHVSIQSAAPTGRIRQVLTTPPSILSLVVGKAHFKVNEPNMRMKSRLGVEPGPTFAGHLQPAPLIAYI